MVTTTWYFTNPIVEISLCLFLICLYCFTWNILTELNCIPIYYYRKVKGWKCPHDGTKFRNKMCPQISIGVDDEGKIHKNLKVNQNFSFMTIQKYFFSWSYHRTGPKLFAKFLIPPTRVKFLCINLLGVTGISLRQ